MIYNYIEDGIIFSDSVGDRIFNKWRCVMSDDMVRLEEFGKDLGVVHEAVVTGRKVGAGKDFWSALAHQQAIFAEVANLVHTRLGIGKDYSKLLAEYEKYYWKIHGLKTDFAGIAIPAADNGQFPWFVCRPENFFAERAYSGGKRLYSKGKWTDKSLDDILDLSFGRDGKKESYIVRFHANWEADKNLANLSANKIAKKGINTACLTERLILGDFLFWEFKKHLDVETITLCSGSRCSGSFVPSVGWDGYYDKLLVGRCGPDDAADYLRSREAVS